MTAPTELLPCPFCGGKAIIRSNQDSGNAWGECTSCMGQSGGYQELDTPEHILRDHAAKEWNRRLPASEAGWPEREEGVDEVILPYAKFISTRPELLSLLYDIDMLPEQCVTRVGAVRLAGLCEVWRKGEDGSLPSAPDRSAA